MFNFAKRLLRLFRVRSKGQFKKLTHKEELKLSKTQIDELIDLNKDAFSQMGDDADYDGMGDYGRFPSIKKNNP